jgi:hypothetical protein
MMPLHRRVAANSKEESYSSVPQEEDDDGAKLHHGSKNSKSWIHNPRYILAFLAFMQLSLLALAATKTKIKSGSHLLAIILTTAIASSPIFLALGAALFSPIQHPHQRYIPLAMIAAIAGNQLPSYLTAGVASAALVWFGLVSKPLVKKQDDEKASSLQEPPKSLWSLGGPIPTVLGAMLMIAVLLTENFFVWVVSATYFDSQKLSTLPKPLQDNGNIAMKYFFKTVLGLTKKNIVTLRSFANVQWALVTGLGLSLVFVEMQGAKIKRNLWSLALRGLLTMTAARAIRTVSFLITVLPSQNPNCYFSHFPSPPPEDWASWLLVGMIPQSNGGCNDLIISGHATGKNESGTTLTKTPDNDQKHLNRLFCSIPQLHRPLLVLLHRWWAYQCLQLPCGCLWQWTTWLRSTKAFIIRSTCGWVLSLSISFGQSWLRRRSRKGPAIKAAVFLRIGNSNLSAK